MTTDRHLRTVDSDIGDPLDGPTPPPVVCRFEAPDHRTTSTLRAPVWHDGSWCTCFDRTYRPGAGWLAPHRHEDTEEAYFVREGTVRYMVGGRLRTARAGDVVTIPKGATHLDPWATAAAPVRMTVLLRPAAPAWLQFGLRLGEAIRHGRLNLQGQMRLVPLMEAVHVTGADVLAAGLPSGLQRRYTTPALARLAEIFGGRR